jgi:tyrosine aminotransferase
LLGCAVEYKDWLCITFAIDPSSLEDRLDRLKSFCLGYKKATKSDKIKSPAYMNRNI